ncbi:hypothetical protein QFZ76_004622 [Streptomyces sp. V4I2]|nr:hypothetical protein [Streptomyces sp. V4I2]
MPNGPGGPKIAIVAGGVRPAQSAVPEKHHEKITYAPHRRWPFRWVPPEARPLRDLGIFDEDPAATCAYLMGEGMVAIDRPRATHPAQPSRHVTVFGDWQAEGKRAAMRRSGYTRTALSAVILTVGRFTLTCNRPEGRLRRVCAGVVVVGPHLRRFSACAARGSSSYSSRPMRSTARTRLEKTLRTCAPPPGISWAGAEGAGSGVRGSTTLEGGWCRSCTRSWTDVARGSLLSHPPWSRSRRIATADRPNAA